MQWWKQARQIMTQDEILKSYLQPLLWQNQYLKNSLDSFSFATI